MHKVIVSDPEIGRVSWELPEPLGSVFLGDSCDNDPTTEIVNEIIRLQFLLISRYVSKTIGGAGLSYDGMNEALIHLHQKARMKEFLDISDEIIQSTNQQLKKL